MYLSPLRVIRQQRTNWSSEGGGREETPDPDNWGREADYGPAGLARVPDTALSRPDLLVQLAGK